MENIRESEHGNIYDNQRRSNQDGEYGIDTVDPLSHLALLKRSKSAPEYEELLNFGPAWYAPLVATAIGASALFAADIGASTTQVSSDPVVFETSGHPAYLVAIVVSLVFLGAHYYRNRVVRPKATKTSVALMLVAIAVVIAIAAVWHTAVVVIGYDDFVIGGAVLAWALTTGFFLALRAGLDRVRLSRRVAAA